MIQRIKQNCPLCNSRAEYCFADYDKRKHFFCVVCGEYQITDTAEQKLATAPQEWRTGYSANAQRVKPDQVFSIFVPSGMRNKDTAYESIRGEVIPRKDLPPCR